MKDSFAPGKTVSDVQLPFGVRQFRAETRLPLAQIATKGGVKFQPKNVSIGGLYLLAPIRPAVGTLIALTLWFGDKKHMVEARVTHSQADGFGVSFVAPSDALTKALRDVLDDHIPPIERDAYQSLKNTMYRELSDLMRIAWSHGDQRYEATLFELSDTGVFLQSDVAPEYGAKIQVYLPRLEQKGRQMVAEHLHSARAAVEFRNSGLIGARFEGPSAEFRVTIRELLARAAAK